MPTCFLTREKMKDVDLDGSGGREEWRGVGGGETIIRIYCIKTPIFNKRKNFLLGI